MATFNRTAEEIVDLLHLWKADHGSANNPAQPVPDAPQPLQEPRE
jgi:hypothetical protein